MLRDVEASSVYHHFWGALLQPRFEEREYNNDFAAWVRHGVHDPVLAERLAALHPGRFTSMEELRDEMVELIDDRVDEDDALLWVRATLQFEFLRSQIVVFDTGMRLSTPADLADAVPRMSTSSVFYHFVDARRRTETGHDDFTDWITAGDDGLEEVCRRLNGVDPYYGNLVELRTGLVEALEPLRHAEV